MVNYFYHKSNELINIKLTTMVNLRKRQGVRWEMLTQRKAVVHGINGTTVRKANSLI